MVTSEYMLTEIYKLLCLCYSLYCINKIKQFQTIECKLYTTLSYMNNK